MSILLAANGSACYRIVCPEDAVPAVRRAAEELSRFLGEMTGAEFPVASGAEDARVIRLTAPEGADLSALGEEGVLHRVCPDGQIFLTGNSPRAVLYAVYTFLGRLGCRWFTPEISRIPRRETLSVETGEYTHVPAFEYREPFYTEAFDGDWAVRNCVNGEHMRLTEREGGKITYFPGRFVHTFFELLPPAELFEAHPEYYSEINGVRTHEHAQLCLTNPQVLRLVTERVRAELIAHPECRIFSISQNDWFGPCACENCRCVDEEEGSHAGTLIRFVNAVAEALEPEFPDVWFDTLAYQYTRSAPKITRPRPNVIVRLCSIECCFTHPLGTCDQFCEHFVAQQKLYGGSDFLTDLENWSKICDRLYVWDYCTNFRHYLLPYPDTEVLAPNLRFFRDHHVRGLFEEGAYGRGGGGYLAELHSYILARLMWEPELDENLLADEFIAGVYRSAAPVMKRIFAAYRAQILREDYHMMFAFSADKAFLDQSFIRSVRELFGQAKLAADDETVLRQVRKAELWQRFLELSHAAKSEARDAEIDRFAADCASFGIDELSEGRAFADSISQMKDADFRCPEHFE